MDTASTPKKKNKLPGLLALLVILSLGGYFGYTRYLHSITYETTDNAQVESNALPVLSRISGFVDSLKVKDFQVVTAGESLVKIDARELEITEQQAFADLLTAQADLSAAKAGLVNTGANKMVAVSLKNVQQVRLQKARNDLQRDEALYNDGSITKRQFEDSKANFESAAELIKSNDAQIEQAATQNGSASAQIQKALALIKVREAALNNARLRLSFANIAAPADGKVGKIFIQPGQYVQPGQVLFNIVNNEHFWIVANYKETQLENMKIGQLVNIKLDGYPNKKITGKLAAFSSATGAKFSLLPPDNSTGNFVKVTQRIPVKIEIDAEEGLRDVLRTGLSVEVEVKVK